MDAVVTTTSNFDLETLFRDRDRDQAVHIEEARNAIVENKEKLFSEIVATRRALLKELFSTLQTQQEDFSIKVACPPDESHQGFVEFLHEWDVTESNTFKSIESFEPAVVRPGTVSPEPTADDAEDDDADDAMDVSIEIQAPVEIQLSPEQLTRPSEPPPAESEDEKIVALDLEQDGSDDDRAEQDVARVDEQEPAAEDQEESMDIDEEKDDEAKPTTPPTMEPSESGTSPADVQLAPSDQQPRSPSSSSLSELDPIPEQIPEDEGEMTIEPTQMHIDSSSIPQSMSTMLATSSFIPHYTVTESAPPRPTSPNAIPSYSDLAVLPPTNATEPKLLPPLLSDYALTLYPLPPLTASTSKKSKKKEKERAAAAAAAAGMLIGGPGTGYGSNTSRPMDLPRWQATLMINPVFKLFRKTSKCISSQEWAVAYTELRFLRAIHRVDQMRHMQKWSFRQPKRSKGPSLTKVHWDWVLDEMRWLQTDFREERKWKMATAFELAHTAAAYYRASEEERRDMCVKWQPPPPLRLGEDADMDRGNQEVELVPRVEPDVVEDLEKETDNFADDEETTETKPEALDGLEDVAKDLALEELNDTQPAGPPDMTATDEVIEALDDLDERKREETEKSADGVKEEAPTVDFAGFRPTNAEEVGEEDGEGEAEPEPDNGGMAMADLVNENATEGIRGDPSTSAKPGETPGGQQNANQTLASASEGNAAMQLDVQALRQPILNSISLEATTIDLSNLSLDGSLKDAPLGEDSKGAIRSHQPIKLPELFPELAMYGPFVGPPPDYSGNSNNNSKSSGSKQKDATKRVDETNTLGKIAYASRMLDVKPVLVSTLQPAKKRRLGQWEDLAEFYPGDDTNPELKPTDFYLPVPAPLFTGPRKPREYPPTHAPQPPKDVRERGTTLIWTPEEDAHLKHLAYLYSLNWKVIADTFATWRVTINTDRRTEWDCFERWNRLWGPSGLANRALAAQQLAEQQQQQQLQQESQSPEADSIGARKASRSMAQSVFKKPPPPPLQLQMPPSNPMNMSTKKQIRRNYLLEAIKKSSKKRDATLIKGNVAKSRVNANVHETHASVSQVHPLTPQQLSQIKFERDAKIAMEQEKRKAEQLRAAIGSRLPPGAKIPLMSPATQVGAGQVRNLAQMQQLQQLQQAALQQQLVAAQQAQRSGQAVASGMQRVPLVSQQAILAQAAQQAQAQAQLNAAHQAQVAAATGSQGSPPRPGSASGSVPNSNPTNATNGTGLMPSNDQIGQQLSPSAAQMMRAQFAQQQQQQGQQQQIANAAALGAIGGFDMSSMTPEQTQQMQAAMAAQQLRLHHQQQVELANQMMQVARANARSGGTPASHPANSPTSNS